MIDNIEGLLAQLHGKNNIAACGALDALLAASADSDVVYPYFSQIAQCLSDRNSFARNRALLLLAANAQWDTDDLFDGIIDEYLSHVTDEKPITARQCIKSLPVIAKEKPHLSEKICRTLRQANTEGYADSMRPLVDKDIAAALASICGCKRA